MTRVITCVPPSTGMAVAEPCASRSLFWQACTSLEGLPRFQHACSLVLAEVQMHECQAYTALS